MIRASEFASGVTVFRVRVDTPLRGDVAGELSVVASDGTPGSFPALRKILFVSRGRSSLYELRDFVDLPAPEETARLAYVREMIAVTAVASPVLRQRELRRAAFLHLPSESPWVRTLALREIHRLVRQGGHELGGEETRAVREASRRHAAEDPVGALAAEIVAASTRTGDSSASAAALPGASESRAAYRRSRDRFREARDEGERLDVLRRIVARFGRATETWLLELAATESGAVLATVFRDLGDMGSDRAAPVILHRLDGDLPDAARTAAIEALGLLGDAAAVTILVAELAVPSRRHAAALALLRIPSGEARAALDALRPALSDVSPVDAELRKLLDAAGTEAFVEAERRAAESRRRRFPID